MAREYSTPDLERSVKLALGINLSLNYASEAPYKATELLVPVARAYHETMDLAQQYRRLDLDSVSDLEAISQGVEQVNTALKDARTQWREYAERHFDANEAVPVMERVLEYGIKKWVPGAKAEIEAEFQKVDMLATRDYFPLPP